MINVTEQEKSEHIKNVKTFCKVGAQVLGLSIVVNLALVPMTGISQFAYAVMTLLFIFVIGGLVGTKVFKWR